MPRDFIIILVTVLEWLRGKKVQIQSYLSTKCVFFFFKFVRLNYLASSQRLCQVLFASPSMCIKSRISHGHIMTFFSVCQILAGIRAFFLLFFFFFSFSTYCSLQHLSTTLYFYVIVKINEIEN